MKNIVLYIKEGFKLSSKNAKKILKVSKIADPNNLDTEDIPEEFMDEKFPDDKKRRVMNNGKELLWWKFWRYLAINGPMTKEDLLTAFNLKVTSYTTLFVQLNKENIILHRKEIRTMSNGTLTIKKGNFLEAQPISKWEL